MRRILTAFILSILPLTGCAVGDTSPYEGYETPDTAGNLATIVVPKNGISSPPPPFYPGDEVEVDIDGDVDGDRTALFGGVVMAQDLVGGDEVECVLDPGRSEFRCHDLIIDVTDNCIGLWVVDADGREGPQKQYQAVGRYESGKPYIETTLGCE